MVEQQRQQFAHAKRPPNSPQFTTKVFAKITTDPDLQLQRVFTSRDIVRGQLPFRHRC